MLFRSGKIIMPIAVLPKTYMCEKIVWIPFKQRHAQASNIRVIRRDIPCMIQLRVEKFLVLWEKLQRGFNRLLRYLPFPKLRV